MPFFYIRGKIESLKISYIQRFIKVIVNTSEKKKKLDVIKIKVSSWVVSEKLEEREVKVLF